MKSYDKLYFDIREYKSDYLNRQFSLSNYRVCGEFSDERFFFKGFESGSRVNDLLKKLNLFIHLNESNFKVDNRLAEKRKLFTLMTGYWQSPDYFNNVRSELLKDLVPVSIPLLPAFVEMNDTVAVHIRRTDYLQDMRYGFLGIEYYNNAITMIREKIAKPKFVIFSDDVTWCRNNFLADDISMFEGKGWEADYLQLYVISLCKHQIIANSSFSWWGAWLNTNENKIVIRPSIPFRDSSLLYENHYPKEWLKIEN